MSSPFFSVLRFVIPSLLFIQRPLARLLYNDLFFCASVLLSVSILALSSLLCLSPTTDCSAQRAQRRRRRRRREREREREKRVKGREEEKKEGRRRIIRQMSEGEMNEFMLVQCAHTCLCV